METLSLDSRQKLIRDVDLEHIVINPYQPRKAFDPEELEGLAESIKAVGIIHPPLARPLPNDFYELISGERRYRASKLAGLSKIPVIICEADNALSAEAALVENIQRVDLNAIEIAKALQSLGQEFSLHQEALAKRIGKKRSTVANYLRLLTLPKNIQESVSKNFITMGHAKAILSLDGFEKQQLLHELILRDHLSVRETEKAALRLQEKAKKEALKPVNRDFYLELLAEKIQEKLGTKVSIDGNGKRGRISIDYYRLNDLNRILDLLGVSFD